MTPSKLDSILDRAFLDAHSIDERAVGLATVVSDGIGPPFFARVVGVEVRVVDTNMRDNGFLEVPVVICERDGQRYPLDPLALEDWQHAEGARYIAAYRKFCGLSPWDGQSPSSNTENPR